MRRWEEIYTEADREVQKKAGFGVRQPWGQRPALLIVDVIRSFIGSSPRPVTQSVDEYSTSCGEAGWAALGNIRKLLGACREAGLPVAYSRVDLAACAWSGLSAVKRGHVPTSDNTTNEIPEEIAPLPADLVIPKVRASAFFGTPLDNVLRARGIDSLIVCGTTTSGCVRATVVDGFSYGYRIFLVEECAFDRFELSHLVNLFDMNAKYADVVTLEDALKYVGGLGHGVKQQNQ